MRKKSRGGFTLVELSLSLVFIGILSVMMVLMIQNTTASYRRGLILNQVNTVGMDLIDDVRASIQGASTDSLKRLCQRIYGGSGGDCDADDGNSLVSVTKYAEVKAGNDNFGMIPVYGAFCTGTYTYVWNSGYFEQGEYAEGRKVTLEGTAIEPVAIKEKTSSGSPIEVASGFRLLKIYDKERTICINANNAQNAQPNNNTYVQVPKFDNSTSSDFYKYNKKVPNEFMIDSSMRTGNLADPNGEQGVELLKESNVADLVLYDFYMARPAASITRKNLFFAGSFILGTRRGGINISTAGNSCKPPSNEYSELDYCAINKFNFAVQAGGN